VARLHPGANGIATDPALGDGVDGRRRRALGGRARVRLASGLPRRTR
jgi:hypothetical protein